MAEKVLGSIPSMCILTLVINTVLKTREFFSDLHEFFYLIMLEEILLYQADIETLGLVPDKVGILKRVPHFSRNIALWGFTRVLSKQKICSSWVHKLLAFQFDARPTQVCKMKTTWKDIPPVPSSQEFLDIVLSRTQRRLPTQIRPGFKITRIRGARRDPNILQMLL